jgi:hypothetical protein
MRLHRSLLSLICIAAAGVAGCSSTLETGYKPRLLGDSAVKQRGYYASPFTPEAKAAQMEHDQELEARRPRPGY